MQISDLCHFWVCQCAIRSRILDMMSLEPNVRQANESWSPPFPQ